MPQSKWERGFWASVRGRDGILPNGKEFKPYPQSHWYKKKAGKKRENGIVKIYNKPMSNKAVKIMYDNGTYRAYYGQNIDHEFQLLGAGKDFKTLKGAQKFAFERLELKQPAKYRKYITKGHDGKPQTILESVNHYVNNDDSELLLL